MSDSYPQRFRMLGDDFRELSNTRPASPDKARLLILHEHKLHGRLGQLIINANNDNLLPLDGLQEIIELHETPARITKRSHPSQKAQLLRCPENLAISVVGGHQVEFINTTPLALSPVGSGGLLPRLGHLSETTPTGAARYALACDVLAGIAEDAIRIRTMPVEVIPLTPEDFDILEALAANNHLPMLLAGVVEKSGYKKEVTRKALERMQKLGLVARPERTQRKGFCITAKGRECLKYGDERDRASTIA